MCDCMFFVGHSLRSIMKVSEHGECRDKRPDSLGDHFKARAQYRYKWIGSPTSMMRALRKRNLINCVAGEASVLDLFECRPSVDQPWSRFARVHRTCSVSRNPLLVL